MEENETFLRWLLIQRARYLLPKGKTIEPIYTGWYIYSKKERMTAGKKLFLETVGIKVIKAKDFETIYEDIWE